MTAEPRWLKPIREGRWLEARTAILYRGIIKQERAALYMCLEKCRDAEIIMTRKYGFVVNDAQSAILRAALVEIALIEAGKIGKGE